MTPKDKASPKKTRDVQSLTRETPPPEIDARRYLREFCDLQVGDELPNDLLMFFQGAFEAYLESHAQSVDQALGLTRPGRGRPGSGFYDRLRMARDLLKARVAKLNHQEALEEVAKTHRCSVTKVGDAWRDLKGVALEALHLLRNLNGEGPFTDDEWERVCKIYKDKPEVLEKYPRDGDY